MLLGVFVCPYFKQGERLSKGSIVEQSEEIVLWGMLRQSASLEVVAEEGYQAWESWFSTHRY